jgi:hypothetical protein
MSDAPPLDGPEGVPSHFRAGAVRAARGVFVMAVRDATHYRDSAYERVKEQMEQLDAVWDEQVSAAWRTYDEELARLGAQE